MLPSPKGGSKPTAHFIGIGGTGMVAAARLALEAGWEIRGSDGPLYAPASDMVEALGVPVATEYNASNLDWDPDLVVVGNAWSRGHAEIEAMLERRMHYVSLPEWLKEAVLRSRTPIAVCGTHGKTTTTALIAHLLDAAGHAPGYFMGGQPLGFPHASRLGKEGGYFVIEGDEYDSAFFDKRAKFFHYLPHFAVVTSLEFDHGDIYDDIAHIERAFQRMLRQIPASGHLVLCADDPHALALREHAHCAVTTYGVTPDADWNIKPGEDDGDEQRFEIRRSGGPARPFATPLSGIHNLQNCAAALAVADLCGIEPDDVREALRTFKGLKRRMETFLEARGCLFVDDFAHHPTAILRTLEGARKRWPERRLIVLFEPRSNTLVTGHFQSELAQALRPAHRVWIGPLYRADTLAENEGLDRGEIARSLLADGVECSFTDDIGQIVDDLDGTVTDNDVVLVLSNGAFGGIYESIRRVFTD